MEVVANWPWPGPGFVAFLLDYVRVRLLSDSVLCELFQTEWDARLHMPHSMLVERMQVPERKAIGDLRPNKAKPSLGLWADSRALGRQQDIGLNAWPRLGSLGPKKLLYVYVYGVQHVVYWVYST
jgi:hypothetical protein